MICNNPYVLYLILVITVYVEGTLTKLPSDSSDSKILHSLSPNLAEFPIEFITPPFIMVGSNLAFAKIEAIKDVVVVLPWDPATTIFFFF